LKLRILIKAERKLYIISDFFEKGNIVSFIENLKSRNERMDERSIWCYLS